MRFRADRAFGPSASSSEREIALALGDTDDLEIADIDSNDIPKDGPIAN